LFTRSRTAERREPRQGWNRRVAKAERRERVRSPERTGRQIGDRVGGWFERTRRVGTALALMVFPLLFVAVYAAYPNLLAFGPLLTLDDWTGRFHGYLQMPIVPSVWEHTKPLQAPRHLWNGLEQDTRMQLFGWT
jgi:hypothetical protein